MWPAGLIASIASDVSNHPVHPVCSSSLFGQDYRIHRIEEDLSPAACSVCMQAARRQDKMEMKIIDHEPHQTEKRED